MLEKLTTRCEFMTMLAFVEESVGGSIGSVGKAVGNPLGKRWKSVGIYPLNGKVLVYVFPSEVTFIPWDMCALISVNVIYCTTSSGIEVSS